MSMSAIERRLAELGLALPRANPTVYAYQPAIRHGNLIYLAGQIPKVNADTLVCTGRLGDAVGLDEAIVAMRACVLNALAWIDELTRTDQAQVVQILRMNYFFQVADGHGLSLSRIADAGSELLVAIFGDRGRHPRSVIGVAELPRNSPVLINMDLAVG